MVALNKNFAPENPHLAEKNRVGDFSADRAKSSRVNRLSAQQPRREKAYGYDETASGMFFYGFRYYDPTTGRWPSRDPIGEYGGLNLHGVVRNDAVNRWDYPGLICDDKCPSAGKTRNVEITNVAFSYGLSGTGKPANLDLLDETLGAINTAGNLSNVAGAAGAAITKGVGGLATNQAQNLAKQSPSGGSSSMASQLIGDLEHDLAKNRSAKVHVTVSYETCEEERCLMFCKRLNWQAPKTGKHSCTFGNPPKPGREITNAEFKRCFKSAIKKFTR